MLFRTIGFLCLLGSTAYAERFVVVRDDAPLYERPASSAARAAVSRPRPRASGYLVFRVLGETPDFIEVESNPDVGWHCYQPPGALQSMVLHAFLRRTDLRPITTGETKVALADGTSVRLGGGLVATPAGAERRIEAEDWSLRLAVPPAAIGLSYEPRNFGSPMESTVETTPGPFRIAGQRLFDLTYPLPAYDVTRRATDVLATIVVRCAVIRLSLPGDRLRDPAGGILGGLVTPLENAFGVRGGAPVYWRDGERAGTVRQRLEIAGSRIGVPGKRCAQLGELPLCFDEADVVPVRSYKIR